MVDELDAAREAGLHTVLVDRREDYPQPRIGEARHGHARVESLRISRLDAEALHRADCILAGRRMGCWIPSAGAMQANPHAADTSTTSVPELPLRSRDALEAYLIANAGKQTPLDALPPLARRRFLDSLVFGRNGLGGFDTGDLETELMPGEVHRLLSIFDLEAYSSNIHSRHLDGSKQWAPAGKAVPGDIESAFDRLYTMSKVDKTRQTALPSRFEAMSGTCSGTRKN